MSTQTKLRFVAPILALAAAALLGCSDGNTTATPYQPDPAVGSTSFVSAAVDEATRGEDTAGPLTPGSAGQDGGGSERTVEEGDIFRPLGSGLVLNLNPWRGLQILDLNDVNAPEVAGSLRLAGTPVEAYVVGDHALVLMNGWQAYFGGTDAANFEMAQGGAVLLVDLSDPSLPTLADHAYVGGDIRSSRLTTGGGQTALYVAAQDASWWYGGPVASSGGGVAVPSAGVGTSGDAVASQDSTLVRSFELVGTSLEPRGQLDLGGWVSDIQATTEALLVASYDWSDSGSTVTLIDISDPTGLLVEGAGVVVAGQVASQFNMDLRGDVLRVVSSGRFSGSDTNHIETFDVSDLTTPLPIDHDTFGEGEQLYGTLFLEDRAFFVTYFVQDPFHAFAIDAEGNCEEKSEFIVSGWNDFFRATLNESRIVGIGVDDAGGQRTVAVSLYDTTDLSSSDPLVARANVALESSWSGASWDHQAFSVLEDVVDALAADGTPETGLVLLPFNGWDDSGYVAGVQVFTFSAETLTARGVMAHGSPVTRTWLADADTAANLSETTLGLHDISAPDAPVAKGTLSLAPSYDELLVFGDHAVRLEGTTDYWWYYDAQGELPDWKAEVVSLTEDPDTAPALATIDVAPGASLVKSGDNLVLISNRYDPEPAEGASGWLTTFETWSMADPATPTKLSTFETDQLRPYYGGWDRPLVDAGAADSAYYYWSAAPNALVVGDALVFLEWRYESEPAGTREVCVTWGPDGREGTEPGGVDPDVPPDPARPSEAGSGADARDGEPVDGEAYYVGQVVCTSENGETPYCQGDIWECAWFESGCEVVDPATIETTTECNTEPFERTWQRWVLHALDLSDPTAPALGAPIEMAKEDQGVTTVVDGSTLYYSYRRPHTVAGDPRPFVKYFVKAVDFSTPAAPVVGEGVNVPGTLLAAKGTTLFTQDYVYNATTVEAAISRLELGGGVATLKARKRYQDRQVQTMLVDGSGHVLVTHRAPWSSSGVPDVTSVEVDAGAAVPAAKADDPYVEPKLTLSVLSEAQLVELSAVEVHTWSELRVALASRAVFQVPGGLLVMNLQDATSPYPQAWFATQAWPRELVPHGDTLLFAGGRYGVYTVDLKASQLLELPAASTGGL